MKRIFPGTGNERHVFRPFRQNKSADNRSEGKLAMKNSEKNRGTLLITGACGGMGLAACERLTEYGYSVYGIDIKEPEGTHAWKYIQADLTKEENVAKVAEELARDGVSLNAIIHHAGIYDLNSLIEMPEEDMQRIWDVNFFAMSRVNRLFLPLLAPDARIILTSSELAPLDPLPFTGIYAVTKTAVEKYAFSLRMELQLLGYKVIVVRPGAVRTSLLNVSTARLEAFRKSTTHYRYNAERFYKIVHSVEAKSVSPEKIAELDLKILQSRHPKYVYSINRNPALLLMHCLPKRLQTAVIRMILKEH